MKTLLNAPRRGTILMLLGYICSFGGLLGIFVWYLMYPWSIIDRSISILITGLCLASIILGVGIAKKQYWATRTMEWILGVFFGILLISLGYSIYFPATFFRNYSGYALTIKLQHMYIIMGIIFVTACICLYALSHFNIAHRKHLNKYVSTAKTPIIQWLLGGAAFLLLVVYVFASPYPVPGMNKHAPQIPNTTMEAQSNESIYNTGENGFLTLLEFYNNSTYMNNILDASGNIVISTQTLATIDRWRSGIGTEGSRDALLSGFHHASEELTGWNDMMNQFMNTPFTLAVEESLKKPYFENTFTDNSRAHFYNPDLDMWNTIILFDSYQALKEGDTARALHNWGKSYSLIYKLFNAKLGTMDIYRPSRLLQQHYNIVSALLTGFPLSTTDKETLYNFYTERPIVNATIFENSRYADYKYIRNELNRVEAIRATNNPSPEYWVANHRWLFDIQETRNRLNIISNNVSVPTYTMTEEYGKWTAKLNERQERIRFCSNYYGNTRPLYKTIMCFLSNIGYNSYGDDLLIGTTMTDSFFHTYMTSSLQKIDSLTTQLLQK